MDIKTAHLETLKAFAFDTLVEIERHQGNLRAINEEIRLRNMPKEAEKPQINDVEPKDKVPAAK